jgi:hypothetical protein
MGRRIDSRKEALSDDPGRDNSEVIQQIADLVINVDNPFLNFDGRVYERDISSTSEVSHGLGYKPLDFIVTSNSANCMTIASKYWTLLELRDKVREDMDLQEETFISDSELASAANEAIDQAEQEVHTLYEDYFLTDIKLFLESGKEKYNLPGTIYAHKIRRMIFENGSEIYRVRRIGDWKKFERKAIESVNNTSTLYEWFLVNDTQGDPEINLVPTSLHTSYARTISGANEYIDFTDDDGTFAVTLANGSFTDPTLVAAAAQAAMNASGSSQVYTVVYNRQTMKFEFTNTTGSVFSLLWSSGVNASANARQALGFSGSDLTGLLTYSSTYGVLSGWVTCWFMRQANRLVDDTDILDIPEASNFVLRYMKNRVLEKDKDFQSLADGVRLLDEERKLMVGTLATMVPDAENDIEPDFTMYEEMS